MPNSIISMKWKPCLFPAYSTYHSILLKHGEIVQVVISQCKTENNISLSPHYIQL